jgi:O-antigen ligase
MGNTAFFAAITLVGLFALWRLKLPSRPLLVLVISILVVDVFVVGTWFGMEKVIDRIRDSVQVQQDEWVIRDQDRLETYHESFDIISKSPVTGVGGGSFYTVYPAWRGGDQGYMDHAHNDYLEFAVEYGLVGLGLLGWFLVLCIRKSVGGLVDRDRAGQFGVSFASLMAVVAMLIHASVDFSLQIPANAAWFVVLCMLPFCVRGAGDPLPTNDRTRGVGDPSPTNDRTRRVGDPSPTNDRIRGMGDSSPTNHRRVGDLSPTGKR